MHTNDPSRPGLNPLSAGVSISRQAGTKTAECAACGAHTQDFVTYDAGPWPHPDRLFRRATANLCVIVPRGKDHYVLHPDDMAEGCATDYYRFAEKAVKSGGYRFMHNVFRAFVKLRRPSLVFPND